MRSLSCLFAIAATLGGCASAPSETALRAEEANNVYPANYRAEILAYLRTYLNDPGAVRNALIAEPVLKPVRGDERYVVCLRYNTRREEQPRGEARDNAAIFFRGKFDRMVQTRDDCRDAAYQPFPELERLTR